MRLLVKVARLNCYVDDRVAFLLGSDMCIHLSKLSIRHPYVSLGMTRSAMSTLWS